jgi:hypothetical protein
LIGVTNRRLIIVLGFINWSLSRRKSFSKLQSPGLATSSNGVASILHISTKKSIMIAWAYRRISIMVEVYRRNTETEQGKYLMMTLS